MLIPVHVLCEDISMAVDAYLVLFHKNNNNKISSESLKFKTF